MYCPQCGTQNEPKQSFCWQCGQRLQAVQLALVGRVDEVIAKFSKAEDLLAGALLTFGIFMLTGLICLAIWGVMPFAVNVILGLIICLPFVLKGLVRIDRVKRLLDAPETTGNLLKNHSASPLAELPAARTTDSLDSKLALPASVTEHTTRELE